MHDGDIIYFGGILLQKWSYVTCGLSTEVQMYKNVAILL